MIYLNIIDFIGYSNNPDNTNQIIELKGHETQKDIEIIVDSQNSYDWYLSYNSCLDEFKDIQKLKDYYKI